MCVAEELAILKLICKSDAVSLKILIELFGEEPESSSEVHVERQT